MVYVRMMIQFCNRWALIKMPWPDFKMWANVHLYGSGEKKMIKVKYYLIHGSPFKINLLY